MRIFISGVMQGSIDGRGIENQGYRQQIGALLRAWNPEVEIIDPLKLWPDSVSYDMDKARDTLLEAIDLAANADAVVAYLPTASMGTALEMWGAYKAGVPVYTITDLRFNWAVHTMSTRVFHAMEDFAAFVHSGGMAPS
jgi:nucleoside 2-deoxyribosyltransferase